MKQTNMFSLLIENNKDKKPDTAIPKGVKLKKGQLWCPYCSMPVKFKMDRYLDIRKCPICGISERDYYVKKVNDTWYDD